MKARYSYALLFLLPAAMLASLTGCLVMAVGAGVLWIFVYGDNRWPEPATTALMAVAIGASAVTLVALLVLSYRCGKAREAQGGLAMRHAIVALGVSVLLPLLVLLHQWQVGNLGNSPVPPNNSSKPTPLRGAA